MAILVFVFGITYSAGCIWLSVRILNRRERWAKWTLATTLSIPVLYMLSFLPLFWLETHGYISLDSGVGEVCRAYASPVRVIYDSGPQTLRNALNWYQNVFR